MADLAGLSEENRDLVTERSGKFMDAGIGQAEADERAFDELIREKQAAAESKPDGTIGNKRFSVKRIGNGEIIPPQWIIKGIIEEDSIIVLYGQSGTRKSFFAINWACCIATGTNLHGMEIKKTGPVVYIAAEGRAGIARRLSAWSLYNKISLKEAPLYGNATPIELIAEGTRESVISCFDVLTKTLETPPVLCVLDTWSRALGGDDSSPYDSSLGLNTVTAIKDRFPGMAVLIVHHEGHQQGRARGWSGLRAGADAEFRVALENDLSILECTKAKDSEFTTSKSFSLKIINLGISDDDGEYITSAVLEETEYKPIVKDKKGGLGINQTRIISLIREFPGKTYADLKTIAAERWGMQRGRIWDAVEALKDRGEISQEGDILCLKR